MTGGWYWVIVVQWEPLISPNVQMSEASFVRKLICPKVHLSESSFVRKFICPKVHLSESSIVRKFICPKVHLSEGSFVRKFICPKVLLSEGSFVRKVCHFIEIQLLTHSPRPHQCEIYNQNHSIVFKFGGHLGITDPEIPSKFNAIW